MKILFCLGLFLLSIVTVLAKNIGEKSSRRILRGGNSTHKDTEREKSTDEKSTDVKSTDVTSEDEKSTDEKSTDEKSTDAISEDVKSTDAISEDVKSKDITSEDVESEDIESEDIESEDIESEDALSEDVESDDVESEDALSEDALSEDALSEDVLSEDVLSEDVESEDVISEDVESDVESEEVEESKEAKPKDVKPKDVLPDYILRYGYHFEKQSDAANGKTIKIQHNTKKSNVKDGDDDSTSSHFISDHSNVFPNYGSLNYGYHITGKRDAASTTKHMMKTKKKNKNDRESGTEDDSETATEDDSESGEEQEESEEIIDEDRRQNNIHKYGEPKLISDLHKFFVGIYNFTNNMKCNFFFWTNDERYNIEFVASITMLGVIRQISETVEKIGEESKIKIQFDIFTNAQDAFLIIDRYRHDHHKPQRVRVGHLDKDKEELDSTILDNSRVSIVSNGWDIDGGKDMTIDYDVDTDTWVEDDDKPIRIYFFLIGDKDMRTTG